jgi:hypothetical protein
VQTLVLLLAVLGVVAILRALARTALRLGLRAAEATSASGMAEVSARRGDITGLSERQQAAREARRHRRRDLVLSFLWLLWLILPAFIGWAPQAYALAAPLWLAAPPSLGLRVRR